MKDIYKIKRQVENGISRIKRDQAILPENKELIFKFIDNCYSENLSDYRAMFYLNRLRNIGQWIDKPFPELTKEDLKALVRKIWQIEKYAIASKEDYNKSLKRFYKWLEGDDEDYPDKVKWIKASGNNNKRKLPEELLTKEEVLELVNAATHIRDKAFISILYESGCRIGEMLGLQIKHVSFDNYGSVLNVYGKTGSRRVRLISASPHLSNWMEHHPSKENPEAPLWVSIGTRNCGKQFMYSSAVTQLRKIAKRAGIKKKTNPHSFRHARATHLASKLTEAQMMEFFGWSRSDTAAIYTHLSGRDIDNAILQMHGKLPKDEEEANGELHTKLCPRCKYENAPECVFCGRCRLPLNLETAIDAETKEKDFLGMVGPEMIEKIIERKVEELLGAKTDRLG